MELINVLVLLSTPSFYNLSTTHADQTCTFSAFLVEFPHKSEACLFGLGIETNQNLDGVKLPI
jgi:hypothetical protein